ncbi:hypothetical protein F183_A28020 [Bryobacterales bacterium F-183]|nr:hypothetical protein F183_A28020 [Bryobacterales bacterium F-183]
MTQTAIELSNLHFGYQAERWTIEALDLEVRRGAKVAIAGANGAGKSTLLLLLNGTLHPCRGEMRVLGKVPKYDRQGLRWLRSHTGLLVQDPDDQIIGSTVEQEVAFGPVNQGIAAAHCHDLVRAALSSMEALDLLHEPIHELSFGQKKRVAIAAMLAVNPAILLLDEPTAGLDHPASQSLLAALDRLAAQGVTILLATHDTEVAYEWADQVLVLNPGAPAVSGTPAEVFSDSRRMQQYRLRQPSVLEIWQKTLRDEVLTPPPRTKEELVQQIHMVTRWAHR